MKRIIQKQNQQPDNSTRLKILRKVCNEAFKVRACPLCLCNIQRNFVHSVHFLTTELTLKHINTVHPFYNHYLKDRIENTLARDSPYIKFDESLQSMYINKNENHEEVVSELRNSLWSLYHKLTKDVAKVERNGKLKALVCFIHKFLQTELALPDSNGIASSNAPTFTSILKRKLSTEKTLPNPKKNCVENIISVSQKIVKTPSIMLTPASSSENLINQYSIGDQISTPKRSLLLSSPIKTANSNNKSIRIFNLTNVEKTEVDRKVTNSILPLLPQIDISIEKIINSCILDEKNIRNRLLAIKELIIKQKDSSQIVYYLDIQSCDNMLETLERMFEFADSLQIPDSPTPGSTSTSTTTPNILLQPLQIDPIISRINFLENDVKNVQKVVKQLLSTPPTNQKYDLQNEQDRLNNHHFTTQTEFSSYYNPNQTQPSKSSKIKAKLNQILFHTPASTPDEKSAPRVAFLESQVCRLKSTTDLLLALHTGEWGVVDCLLKDNFPTIEENFQAEIDEEIRQKEIKESRKEETSFFDVCKTFGEARFGLEAVLINNVGEGVNRDLTLDVLEASLNEDRHLNAIEDVNENHLKDAADVNWNLSEGQPLDVVEASLNEDRPLDAIEDSNENHLRDADELNLNEDRPLDAIEDANEGRIRDADEANLNDNGVFEAVENANEDRLTDAAEWMFDEDMNDDDCLEDDQSSSSDNYHIPQGLVKYDISNQIGVSVFMQTYCVELGYAKMETKKKLKMKSDIRGWLQKMLNLEEYNGCLYGDGMKMYKIPVCLKDDLVVFLNQLEL